MSALEFWQSSIISDNLGNRMSLADYMNALLGLFFPEERSCISCHGMLPETAVAYTDDPPHPSVNYGFENLCPRCCSSLLPIEPPYCLLCGRHISQTGRCPECIRDTLFVQSCSFGKYEGVLRELLHRFKFSREDQLISILGHCLQIAWDMHMSQIPIDWLVPVPIHDKRLKERGYNQAEKLALHLSAYNKIPVLPALIRQSYSNSQATRNRRERLHALKETFDINWDYKEQIRGKRILLVDDVYTTGSTAEACSAALKKAGANQVYVITVAR